MKKDSTTFVQDLILDDKQMKMAAYDLAQNNQAYPKTLDMRDLVLQTQNQGQTMKCAAYTATSWIQSVMWRRTGVPVNYDPNKLYKHAIDTYQNGIDAGMKLSSAMNSIIDLGWVPGLKREDIVLIGSVQSLKRAIHRYGTCLLGLDITNRWYSHYGKLVFTKGDGQKIGGHAVICVGYNQVGVLIQNSWGTSWGKYGFACISWDQFIDQFRVGSYFKNCLNDVETND